jgi:hypothetical protein
MISKKLAIFKKKGTGEPTAFKGRYSPKINLIKLNFGDSGLFFKKSYKIELIYLRIIYMFLKKLIKIKNLKKKSKKI